MSKKYFSLGLMSGTSGDGVDSSVIESNGKDYIKIINNSHDPYPSNISAKIHRICEKINNSSDKTEAMEDGDWDTLENQ